MSALTDTLGVEPRVGDRVRVVHHGWAARLADCGRLATIAAVTHAGNLVLDDDGVYGTDTIARGRAVRPGCVAVMRRDGVDGFEGNR